MWEISTVNSGVTVPTTLNAIETIESNKVVVATNTALHQTYTFYTKITAVNSFAFFGPYNLNVGCFDPALVITDHPTFDVDLIVWVGSSLIDRYIF